MLTSLGVEVLCSCGCKFSCLLLVRAAATNSPTASSKAISHASAALCQPSSLSSTTLLRVYWVPVPSQKLRPLAACLIPARRRPLGRRAATHPRAAVTSTGALMTTSCTRLRLSLRSKAETTLALMVGCTEAIAVPRLPSCPGRMRSCKPRRQPLLMSLGSEAWTNCFKYGVGAVK